MVNVSCVQTRPYLNEVDKNLGTILQYIKEVMEARPETDLIVFPELATTGYEGTKAEFVKMAETIPDGKCMKAIAELCGKYGVYVVYGFAERDPNMTDVMYNSCLVIDDKGKIAGRYRKVHPFDTEKLWCRAGCEYPVFDAPFGRFGVQICWDTAFPEVSRIYALKGVDLLVVSTNWEKPYEEDWDLMTKARAFDNTLHLVAANRIGDDRELGWFGRSKIIDPIGRVIEALDEEVEGVIHASLDLSITKEKRLEYYTFFKDRRPDTYEELSRLY